MQEDEQQIINISQKHHTLLLAVHRKAVLGHLEGRSSRSTGNQVWRETGPTGTLITQEKRKPCRYLDLGARFDDPCMRAWCWDRGLPGWYLNVACWIQHHWWVLYLDTAPILIFNPVFPFHSQLGMSGITGPYHYCNIVTKWFGIAEMGMCSGDWLAGRGYWYGTRWRWTQPNMYCPVRPIARAAIGSQDSIPVLWGVSESHCCPDKNHKLLMYRVSIDAFPLPCIDRDLFSEQTQETVKSVTVVIYKKLETAHSQWGYKTWAP